MTVRHDLQAERMVIGAVMHDNRMIDAVTIKPEDFWDPKHEELWRVIVDERRHGSPVDPVTLSNSTVGNIPGVTPVLLHEIYSEAPGKSATAPHYAKIVAGLAKLRRIQELGAKLQQAAADSHWGDTDAPLDEARAMLETIANETAGVQVRTFADILDDAVKEWESPITSRAQPTGWSELDDYLNGGWKPGQVTILGARPAVGKSLVAGCATVASHNYGAGFFSLEMSERELAARLVATEQGIDLSRIETHNFTPQDWDKIRRLQKQAPEWRVFVEAQPRRSMAQLRATIRTWRRRGPVPLVIVDYLQLLAPAAGDEKNRERQVSRLAEDCKALAKEFDCHMLVLAQVNRGSTQRDDKRPTMADLRESGGIEANADNIILLHREEEEESEMQFIIAKNRHGQTGTIHMAWRPHFASVNSMTGAPNDYRFGVAAA